MATLNISSSIVDFLKSQGKASDFASRNTLYNSLGLGDRLGSYTGSANQNTAFLKTLSSQSAPTSIPTPPAGVQEGDFVAGKGTLTPEGTFSNLTTPSAPPSATNVIQNPPVQPVNPATMTLESLGISKPPTVDEAMQAALSSPTMKLFQEQQSAQAAVTSAGAQAEKAKLEATAKQNQTDLENKLAANGLAFSGIRTQQVQSLVDTLAASELGVDREVASKLMDQNFNLREKILSSVTDVVKNAESGRKDAISALEKVGLTVIGNQVVPTLAARSAQRADEAAQRADVRLQLSEDAAVRAEQRLQLAEQADQRAADRLDEFMKQQGLGYTASERLRTQLAPVFKETAQVLSNKLGPGRFVDIKDWFSVRSFFLSSYPDKAKLFDDAFADQFLSSQDKTTYTRNLSPFDLELLGVGQ